MPKAMVATITTPSSRWKRSWCAARAADVHPGVIGQRRDALRLQPRRGLVDLLARQAIDDARFAGMLFLDEAQQLRARVVLVDDGVADVRPVEARDEDARLVQRQPPHDLVARLRVGGGGERDARHLGKALVQHRELQVFRAEVVPPLRDAVRLVDGEERELRLGERLEHARHHQALGRDVQQIQLSGQQRTFGGIGLTRLER